MAADGIQPVSIYRLRPALGEGRHRSVLRFLIFAPELELLAVLGCPSRNLVAIVDPRSSFSLSATTNDCVSVHTNSVPERGFPARSSRGRHATSLHITSVPAS